MLKIYSVLVKTWRFKLLEYEMSAVVSKSRNLVHNNMESFNMDLQCPELRNFIGVAKRDIFRRVRKIAKSYYERGHVCPNGTTRLPLATPIKIIQWIFMKFGIGGFFFRKSI